MFSKKECNHNYTPPKFEKGDKVYVKRLYASDLDTGVIVEVCPDTEMQDKEPNHVYVVEIKYVPRIEKVKDGVLFYEYSNSLEKRLDAVPEYRIIKQS